jgi:hypothetical protein
MNITIMVGTNLVGFVTSHEDSVLFGFLVLENLDVSCSTLFPLVVGLVESKQFCTPFGFMSRVRKKRER